jgi:hypothetical protein
LRASSALGGLALGDLGLGGSFTARFGVQLGLLALLGLAHPRIGERALAGVLLILAEGAQHHAGARRLLGDGRSAGPWAWAQAWRPAGFGLRLRGGVRAAGHRRTLALGLHHHGLGAAMGKALPYPALLDRGLAHAQRPSGGPQLAIVLIFRFAHAWFKISFSPI